MVLRLFPAFLILVFSESFIIDARAVPICEDLTCAIYNVDPVLDPRVVALIQNHSISKYAKELAERGIVPNFNLDPELNVQAVKSGIGYVVQRRMLKKLLSTIFPESQFLSALDSRKYASMRPTIEIREDDSAMRWDWRIEEERGQETNTIQMVRAKMGNAQTFSFSKEAIRNRYGIPIESKVGCVYSDTRTLKELGLVMSKIHDHADYVFVSASRIIDEVDVRIALGKDHPVFRLSELASGNQKLPAPGGQRVYILNDTVGRMPELYAASDYAIVMGPNNFYEPLMVRCPTLIYAGNPNRRFEFSRSVWNLMKWVATATGGMVDVFSLDEMESAFLKLLKIRSENILHPAFVRLPGETKTGFEILLDRLDTAVRLQTVSSPLVPAVIDPRPSIWNFIFSN